MSPWPWGGASGGGGGDGVDGRADHFGRSAGGEGWAVPPGRVWGGGLHLSTFQLNLSRV